MRHQAFKHRMVLSTLLFILVISTLCLAVVYYWSFIHFRNLFEDRVIDQYTFQQNQSMGVKNQWILGVTTDSIDVVEGIHGESVAARIQQRALTQQEQEQLYRETIDGKHLLYMIELDTEHGETLYKYSVIKDIYAETFPEIAAFFLLFFLIITALSVMYSESVSGELYGSIQHLRDYTKRIARGKPTGPVEICSKDEAFLALAADLETMRRTIEKDQEIRQNALQYISHEMKTPIMVIEGYTASAVDEIYPKGDLNSSLRTILTQTERLKQRVQDLLTIVHLDATNDPGEPEDVPLLPCIQRVLKLLEQSLSGRSIHVDVDDRLIIRGCREHSKILIENMISNQAKYAERQIAIRQEETTDAWLLKFSNDGAPIPEEIRENLFKPFVKGSQEGSGLGLAICQGIMKRMGGSIALEDTEEGVCFVLTFPKIKGETKS